MHMGVDDKNIDLLIVEPDTKDQKEQYLRVIKSLRGLGYPFDILFITTEWFEDSKELVGGIARPANKHGKVIYEAA
jgi:hypothetical protein